MLPSSYGSQCPLTCWYVCQLRSTVRHSNSLFHCLIEILRNLVFVHVLMWGVVVASMAAAKDFKGLVTARFFLGLFEATVGS